MKDEKKTPTTRMAVRTQFILFHSDHVFLSRSTSVSGASLNIISFRGKKYIKVIASAETITNKGNDQTQANRRRSFPEQYQDY